MRTHRLVLQWIEGLPPRSHPGVRRKLTANLPDWDSTAARLRVEYRGILAAISSHDGGRAARLVAAHIEGYCREAGVRPDAKA